MPEPYGAYSSAPNIGGNPYPYGGNTLASSAGGSNLMSQQALDVGTGRITNPQTAVINALMDMGINPRFGNPLVQHVMSKASDLINSMYLGLGGQTGSNIFANPQALAAAVRNQVGQALSGGNVFFGGNGQQALQQLQALGQQGRQVGANGMPTNENAAYIADLLANPDQAGSLMNSMLYGGANSTIQRSLNQNTALLPTLFQRQLEQHPTSVGSQDNLLDMLFQNKLLR